MQIRCSECRTWIRILHRPDTVPGENGADRIDEARRVSESINRSPSSGTLEKESQTRKLRKSFPAGIESTFKGAHHGKSDVPSRFNFTATRKGNAIHTTTTNRTAKPSSSIPAPVASALVSAIIALRELCRILRELRPYASKNSRFFEIARSLVRFDHVARIAAVYDFAVL